MAVALRGAALLVGHHHERERDTNNQLAVFTILLSREVRRGEARLSESPEGVESPLGFFDDCCGVGVGSQVVGQVDSQELDAAQLPQPRSAAYGVVCQPS